MTTIDIRILAPETAADGALVDELTGLVNAVYKTAEQGLWTEGTVRTTTAEMASLIGQGQIAVARLAGRIVGSVRLQRLESGEGEFGMLVADPRHRGIGIGRELVRFAERWTREHQLATLQLELLVPREGTHPVKEFLKDWYTRLGFRAVRTGEIEESYPALAPLLARACDFVIYHKAVG